MLHPVSSEIPSESTIATLFNHHILEILGSPHAWIFSPTTNQERVLNYDASLQGLKACLIQYKRMVRVNQNGTASVVLDRRQHQALIGNYSNLGRSYLFYAFSFHRAYADVERDYRQFGSPQFIASMALLDVHSVPSGTTSLSLRGRNTLRAFVPGKGYSSNLNYQDGKRFVLALKSCSVGLQAQRIAGRAGSLVREGEQPPQGIHFVLWDQSR